MALDFSFNTQVTTNSGTKLDIAYARLQLTLLEDESNANLRLDLYESSTAYMNNRRSILIDEITPTIQSFTYPITPGQYADVDMTNVHNQMKNILLDGSSHPNYPDTADQTWGGLEAIDPSNSITVTMPS